jgi:hypothetical protein
VGSGVTILCHYLISKGAKAMSADNASRSSASPSRSEMLVICRTILLATAVLPVPALAQPSDYRTTETTQGCERADTLHASVENAKRGLGGMRLGCTTVPKGMEVRQIQQQGDATRIVFCTAEGCLRRWVLTSVLGPNGI